MTIESLNKYLNGNGKYPNELILEAIVREIDMSKLVNLDCTDVAYAVASFNANESKKMTINAKTISVKQTEEQPINSLKSTNLVFPHSKAIGLKDNHLT